MSYLLAGFHRQKITRNYAANKLLVCLFKILDMRKHVNIKLDLEGCNKGTFWTKVNFFVGMNTQVPAKDCALTGSIRAVRTRKRSVSTMSAHMRLEVTLLGSTISTL